MNNITQPSYKEEVTQYTKKDAIHALLFVMYFTLMACGSSLLMIFNVIDADNQTSFVWYLSGVVFALLTFAPLFVIVKKKRQGLRSLGLHVVGWKKALFAGLFFVAVFLLLFHGLLPGLLADWQMRSPAMVVWAIIYLIIMAACEDIVYRGYGDVKNPLFSV